MKYKLIRKNVKELLSDIYIINGIDVMGFEVTPTNIITYHHLIKVEDLKMLGFPTDKTMENGIVLTRNAHSYLHMIEETDPEIFYHINQILFLITKEKRLPTIKERNLIQIFLEAFEYRVQDYLKVPSKYLRRTKMS